MSPEPEMYELTPESIRERLSDSFPGKLGIEPLDISAERSRGRLLAERRHLHPGGYVHGGVWTALADTVAAWGTFRNLPVGSDFTTVELKLNVFAAAVEGDELIATAEPQHVGRRTQVWMVRIEKGGQPAALFTLTQFVLDPSAG